MAGTVSCNCGYTIGGLLSIDSPPKKIPKKEWNIRDMGGKIRSGTGIWGAMSDYTRSFKPWTDNFSKGLYPAGVECDDNAEAPEGWTKWVVPGYEYIYTECEDDNTFVQVINYISKNDITLVGAVHDFTCSETGKNYIFFSIRSI